MDQFTPTACGTCHLSVPADASFCPHCGTRLRKSVVGDRRYVSILYVDIVGYTDLCARVDEETVHELLQAFFTCADAIVKDLGGYVIDHAGDALVAVFGAPSAHQDDPARAVQAAIDIHAASQALEDPRGGALRLHAAVATGDVVAAPIGSAAASKYTITGEPVNLAARICSVAAAGSTLVSHTCYRLVAHRFHARSTGEHVLKGLSELVTLWSIEGWAEEAAEAPFIGRHEELARGLQRMEQAAARGQSLALGIRGDPGIGKSCLASRIAAEATMRGRRILSARFLDFPLAGIGDPLAGLFCTALHLKPDVPAAELRARLSDVVLYSAAAELLRIDLLGTELSPRDELEYDVRLRNKGDALAYAFSAAVADGSIMVVLEDLHWADRDALAVLGHAMEGTAKLGILFLWTTRPLTEGNGFPTGTIASLDTAIIDLPPLKPSDARALASRIREGDPKFVEQCIERAVGNPLFLVNLIQAGSESDEPLPGNLRSVVLARVDRLPEAERMALQASAVLGPVFHPDQLEQLLKRAGLRLDAALRAGLLRRAQGWLEFSHALVHEAIYTSILRARRRELHMLAAQLFGARDPQVRAEHLDRGGSADASAAYLEAAHAEWTRHGAEACMALARRGLELQPSSPIREGLLALLAQVLLEVGRTRDAITEFKQALEGSPPDPDRCRALLGLADAYRTIGDYPASLTALDEAQAIAERQGMQEELSRLHGMRGNVYFARFDAEHCAAEHHTSLQVAKVAGYREGIVRALIGQGDAAYSCGKFRAAAGSYEEARKLAYEQGLTQQAIAAEAMCGLCLMYLGRLAEGMRCTEAALSSARNLRSVRAEVMVESIRLTLLYNSGAYHTVEEVLGDVLGKARAAQVWRFEHSLLRWAGVNAFALGKRSLALERLEAALHLARGHTLRFNGASILGAIALVTNDAERRQQAFREGIELLELGSISHSHLNFYRDTMDGFLLAGEPRRALHMADRLEQYAAEESLAWSRLHARRGRSLARVLLAPGEESTRAEAAAAIRNLQAAGLNALLHCDLIGEPRISVIKSL